MQLPISLRTAVEQELSSVSFGSLNSAATELSDRYRQQRKAERFITTDAHRLAYLAVRMPATFAAVSKALAQLGEEFHPESLLDLGAGTGSAAWAAAELFDTLQRFTLVEQDSQLIELGRKLAQESGSEALRSADWRLGNLRNVTGVAPHDLVICSYSLGEIESVCGQQNRQICLEGGSANVDRSRAGNDKRFCDGSRHTRSVDRSRSFSGCAVPASNRLPDAFR